VAALNFNDLAFNGTAGSVPLLQFFGDLLEAFGMSGDAGNHRNPGPLAAFGLTPDAHHTVVLRRRSLLLLFLLLFFRAEV